MTYGPLSQLLILLMAYFVRNGHGLCSDDIRYSLIRRDVLIELSGVEAFGMLYGTLICHCAHEHVSSHDLNRSMLKIDHNTRFVSLLFSVHFH